MTESAKTLIFLAIAIVSLGAGYFGSGVEEAFDPAQLVGDELTADFDVEAPKRLQIIKFDPATTETREFEVAEEDNLWTIPSKEGYPADAAEQMADAATGLVGLEVLRIAASSQEDHEKFGVVDPLSKGLNAKSEGVGIRVTMMDDKDEKLIDLIIGDEVKGTPEQRYVRKGTQDIVYVVEASAENLTTNFAVWIEDDLLKLNAFDIKQLDMNDYSIELGMVLTEGGLSRDITDFQRREQMTFSYDRKEAEWAVENIRAINTEARKIEEVELAEDEELNQDALKELAEALDDLKIIDVERKPKGISASLKAGELLLESQAAMENLMSRGYAPKRLVPGGPIEILSSEGEIIVTMNDGVEYLLRFGGLQLDGEPAEEGTEGVHRYLFVTARLNEDVIEEPEYEKLPPLPSGTEEEDTSGESEETESAEDARTEADEPVDETVEEEEEEEEQESTDVAAGSDDEASAPEASEPEEDEEGDDTASEEPSLEEIKAERARIKVENQRKRDEYNDKIKEAKQRVKDLNERFGDWYYVIDNSVYKKIRLSRKDLVVKKEAEDEESDEAPANPLSGLPSLPGQEQ
ncbi:MAG: DUF4340 domain-containing protein [Lacipirellulaceae bacterium]